LECWVRWQIWDVEIIERARDLYYNNTLETMVEAIMQNITVCPTPSAQIFLIFSIFESSYRSFTAWFYTKFSSWNDVASTNWSSHNTVTYFAKLTRIHYMNQNRNHTIFRIFEPIPTFGRVEISLNQFNALLSFNQTVVHVTSTWFAVGCATSDSHPVGLCRIIG